MIHAIILAGGLGTRFWPLSRQHEPKQFLRIFSGKPMIEETIRRVSRLIDKDNIYIATNQKHYKKIRACLDKLHLPSRNIFFEPLARNTLAPIGVLSKKIYEKDRDAVVVVLPSDHYVKYESRFLEILKRAAQAAGEGSIVTLGIKPDRPETGYGYIKVRSQGFQVERFIEKPTLKKAKELIKDKRFYWNAGIFIFRPDTLLEEMKRWTPREFSVLNRITDKKSLKRAWPHFASVSVDYAIMEKSRRLELIPADIGWLDLGSWGSVEKLEKKDRDGNVLKGNCVTVGTRRTLAWSDNRLLALVGIEDAIVVNTKDAILVCAKDRAQEVKKLVQVLRQKKLTKQI